MNFAGKFGSGGPDSLTHAHFDIDSLPQSGHGDTVTVPDAHLLFSGDFHRAGSDLIISDQSHRVVVPNYFQGDKRPALASPDGAPLDPSVVDALTGHTQYAQAGGAPAAKVVGHVAKLTGSASIVRNGVAIDLQNGDAVYQSDVVQTGSNSTIGLVLNDGTTFNLSANARLMLNDLTYDAGSTSNSSLITLVQGAASFVAGQVARTGDMKVATPVATMGIRGTAVNLDISSTDGKVTISVIDQHDGQVHAVQVFNSQGTLIGTVTSNGSLLTLTPTATFEVIAQESNKTPAQIAQEFATFQDVLHTYEIQKAIDPNLPQHTENNANPQTKYASAGSTPSSSPQTEYHSAITAGSITSTSNGHDTTFVIQPNGPPGGSLTGLTSDQTLQDTPPSSQHQQTADTTAAPFVVDPPTVTPITSGQGNHSNPVMSASGDVVYDPDGIIYYYSRGSGVTIRVTPANDGISYSGETISSDGRYVAYQGTDGTHTYVYIWGTDPSDTAHYHVQTQLVAGSSPAISGDGSTILVEQAGGAIGIYDLQGHSKGTITPASIGATGALSKPAISADGHLIVFWAVDGGTPGGAGHLDSYNVSTGAITEIASTASGAGSLAASVSADGRYVVYQSQQPGGHTEISMYDLNTGHVVFSTADAHELLAGNSRNPVISPDGHFIIFTSDAQLTPGDTNTYADAYVVDVSNLSAPAYTLISEHGNAPSDGGVAISAGGLFVAFGSDASFSTSSTGTNIFLSDASSGRSVIIQETANSPEMLTASGHIGITGGSSGVTLKVTDLDGHPTNLITASLGADGKSIVWNFSESKSEFSSLHYGQDLTQKFLITLTYSSGSTTVPLSVTVHDAVQPILTSVDVAPVANPVTLADGHENTAYTITPAMLLAGVGDIDGPSLSITDVSIKAGGGTLVHKEDGTWTYTPDTGFHGEVAFNYTASDGTLTSSSTASLSVENHPATITGDATGNLIEDATTTGISGQIIPLDTCGGTLTVHDIDPGDDHFRPVSTADLTGAYGKFIFDRETGEWTYELDTAKADSLSDGQVFHDQLTVTSADGTASKTIDVTVTGTNDSPLVASGTVVAATIDVPVAAHNNLSPELAAQLHASGLISGLPGGGASGYGVVALPSGDDNSSYAIDITSVFGSGGIDFFGHHYTSLYINNNGNISFNAPIGAFTPSTINGGTSSPIIAPFWADVDTRATGGGAAYYDLDTVDGVMTITWDHVGYFSYGTDKLDTFQLVLVNEGNGNFDIEYRYGDIQWTTGNASGGSDGLGGTPARAGYSAGDGTHYFELSQSGDQSALLQLSTTPGNTGIAGVDHFDVRNGEVGPPELTATGTINFSDPNLLDTHSIESITYTGAGTALGTLALTMLADTTGTGTGGQFIWTYAADPAAVHNALDGATTHSKVETFDVVISDGHGGTLTQTVSVTLNEPDSNAPPLVGNVSVSDVDDQTASRSVTSKLVGDLSNSSWSGAHDDHGGAFVFDPPSETSSPVIPVVMHDPGPASGWISNVGANAAPGSANPVDNFAFHFADITHDEASDLVPAKESPSSGQTFASAQGVPEAAHDNGLGLIPLLDTHDAIQLPIMLRAQMYTADFHVI